MCSTPFPWQVPHCPCLQPYLGPGLDRVGKRLLPGATWGSWENYTISIYKPPRTAPPGWNRRPVHIVMVVAIYKTIKKNGLASCPGGHSLSRHLAYKLTLSRTGRHRESWTQTSGTRLSTPPAGSSPNGKAPCSSRQWPHTQLSSHRWEAPSEVSGVHLASPQLSLLFW